MRVLIEVQASIYEVLVDVRVCEVMEEVEEVEGRG